MHGDIVFYYLIGLVLIVLLIAGPVAAWIAYARTRQQRKALAVLVREVRDLRLDLAKLEAAAVAIEAIRDGLDEGLEVDDVEDLEPPQPPPPPPIPPPQPSEMEPEQAMPAAAAPEATVSSGDFERVLTSKWLVWLGGVVLALAGVFLVKYSIDMGWLGPAVRCTLGVIGGLVLMVGGEWLRRQPLQRAIASVEPNYVAAALTAAGVVTVYASIYAAYGLYDLMPPLLAFILLAGTSVLAFGLALMQGPFIAVLGVLGGYLVPVLVSTGNQSALALFPYLFALAAATQWIVRYRA